MTLTEQDRRQVLRTRALTWTGIVATAVLMLAAMFWFPGEGRGDPRGYSFGKHFLSAMGKTRTSVSDNTISCLIFNGTLIMVGSILVMFWKTRARFVTQSATRTTVRNCGLTMGLAMAGIGLTPYDIFPHTHNFMTYAVIVFGVICFCLCLWGSPQEFESVESKLGWLTIVLVAGVAQGLFVVLVSKGIISSRPALPLMQKLFVCLLALWAGWQSFLFGRVCRMKPAFAVAEG